MNCPICNKSFLLAGVPDKKSINVICQSGHRSTFNVMPEWVGWVEDLCKKAEVLSIMLSSGAIPMSLRTLITTKVFEMAAAAILAARVTEVQPDTLGDPGATPKLYVEVCTDGSCHPNPGPAGCGAVLNIYNDGIVTNTETARVPLEEKASNNEAEYAGVLEGLKLALSHGFNTFKLKSDSELVLRQIQGTYKVGEKMRPWLNRVNSFIKDNKLEVTFEHISGNDNPAHVEAEAAYRMASAMMGGK